MGKKKDESVPVDMNLLTEGLRAIREGDYEGANDALRTAKEIQDAAENNARRGKK